MGAPRYISPTRQNTTEPISSRLATVFPMVFRIEYVSPSKRQRRYASPRFSGAAPKTEAFLRRQRRSHGREPPVHGPQPVDHTEETKLVLGKKRRKPCDTKVIKGYQRSFVWISMCSSFCGDIVNLEVCSIPIMGFGCFPSWGRHSKLGPLASTVGGYPPLCPDGL